MDSMPKKEMITISVKDLILYILSKWKVLLICLIAGALVLGAYSGYKSLKSSGSDPLETKAERIAESLNESEKARAMNNAITIAHYLHEYENYSAYNEKSVFQNLNPSNMKVRTLTYYLDTPAGSGSEDAEAGFVNAYRFNLTDEAFNKEVAEAFGIPEEEAFYYYDTLLRIKIDQEQPIDQDVLVIQIYHNDEEFLDKMAGAVQKRVEKFANEVKTAEPAHSIKLISDTVSNSPGLYIYENQEKNVSMIRTMIQDLGKLTDSISGDELVYTKYLLTQVYDGDYVGIAFDNMESEESAAPKLKISKKYVLVGAVGGLAAAALVILLIYLLKRVLRGYGDMEYIYGIPVLGTYDDPQSSKKHRFILDRWLWSLRVKRKSQDYEGCVELISKKLSLMAKNNDVKNICIAIGPSVRTDKGFLDDVIKRTNDLSITVADNILRNAEAINKLFDADGVVLLEQMDGSALSEISEECRLCAGNNIKILGAIVAE